MTSGSHENTSLDKVSEENHRKLYNEITKCNRKKKLKAKTNRQKQYNS